MNKEKEELNNKINEINKEKEEIILKLKESEELNNKINEYENKNKELNDKINNLNKENEELKKKIDDSKGINNENINKMKEEINKLNENIKILINKNEELENKYELTEYLISKPETFRTISYRSIGMVKNVSLSFIKVLRDFSKSHNCIMNNTHDRELMKEASRMGSVMLVDLMSKDEVYNYLYPKLEAIHESIVNE